MLGLKNLRSMIYDFLSRTRFVELTNSIQHSGPVTWKHETSLQSHFLQVNLIICIDKYPRVILDCLICRTCRCRFSFGIRLSECHDMTKIVFNWHYCSLMLLLLIRKSSQPHFNPSELLARAGRNLSSCSDGLHRQISPLACITYSNSAC